MTEFLPLDHFEIRTADEMRDRALEFFELMSRRRSVRHFSSRPVPREVIELCIRTAGTAPSGANQQPWHFVVVESPETKRIIREAAEEEERTFYEERAPQEWLEAIAPMGTDASKPFLEIAPFLIVVFAATTGVSQDGDRVKHYYVSESVGIATGLLIASLHHAGLATLTHTPSPMRFLNEILGRPSNERPFVVIPVGYPADDARVPNIRRKRLAEIATFV
jgi:nitroreductase